MVIRTEKVIDCSEWDSLVQETYGRPYCFQQQDGCKSRGIVSLTVPDDTYDYVDDTVPENVNDPARGVSFKAWLSRDPTQKLSNPDDQDDFALRLWWYRNFYPDINMIANDLHDRGLLEEDEYLININW